MTLTLEEEPGVRCDLHGPKALSDRELLALAIGGAAVPAMEVAGRILERAGSVAALARWGAFDYIEHQVPAKTARRLAAMFEIGVRMTAPAEPRPHLQEPGRIYDLFRHEVLGLEVEKFWVCSLNRKNRLIRRKEITSGTVGSTLVHPSEVFREAMRAGASAVVCVHNHPSGDPDPSAADIRVTRQLREAAQMVEIDLLDHVVVGTPSADPRGLGYYSFRQAGIL